jgi:anti-sigma regulatory factor (Ser/Thr protein kinase)/serine/threonine protein phosphatase PrpC
MSVVHIRFGISHAAHVGEVRRAALDLAAEAGLDETDSGRLALVVTEAGTNIVKHAREGQILLRGVDQDGRKGVEMYALDSGPGIGNLAESLRDGHSTAGSSGTGLGALSRLASRFDIYSRPGKGVALWCEVLHKSGAPGAARLNTGAVCLPKPGETACGDGWLARGEQDRCVLMVVDGLGHGSDAAAAAHAATEAVKAHARRGVTELADTVHGALKSTRGAAAALAVVKAGSEKGDFCGVGNVNCVIRAGGKTRALVSHNGILGHQVRKFQEFSFPFPRDALLIMHSDGLTAKWTLDEYPGLETREPALIAGVLFRDFRRSTDDASVLVARLVNGT